MILTAALAVLAGTLLACFLAILPGLHIYNVMGLAVLLIYHLQGLGLAVAPEIYLPFMISLVVGWSVLNTIPSVLLGAPGSGRRESWCAARILRHSERTCEPTPAVVITRALRRVDMNHSTSSAISVDLPAPLQV